ncbi:bifunctional methylenetetrahydrofolate dehydrogenase/cyclohydrolase, putative [Plasmodium knowlesi strain H]|uniref:Bifunctional methylenetetrahydrofolate dehydrogenase/cyclohydrolase, putative n=3 Tax=Plasmodium knowlesi TaxID=5850 RepID=A0A5K1VNI1_PLAKH|nr:bifunctional methylenetetrahydrofolate dehydrogenase/cyclohydrolase, putative [Plasmodium knowlesi strain H]OTN64469.1 putative Bifunctional methylenetetrahydrofolate dehydrogenase/cyclohydrolase [Plasmodium knowlesi]CAA9989016.1 bifunctional methylenetetrahydrofolate dehydrogenase/cyclohydrolase, putative [Plasmodium knowlesi strain H]SBO24860.1 bifunctional methylenetetrahydrofolate dehydrogenase/cyclohydrolase, putative [Plasmodium knowlesi strain H]SBO27560.1 bifunctional methylenetetrah|eukprot:XP_002261364.1 hypothetical protein, conserved in Plasmodium species [Plasmodium knowlesi strain H]
MNCGTLYGYELASQIDQLVIRKIASGKIQIEGNRNWPQEKTLFIIYSKNIATYSYLHILIKKSLLLNADVTFVMIRVHKGCNEKRLINLIKKINRRGKNTWLIILSPLSRHINKCYISSFISQEKDVDRSNCAPIWKLLLPPSSSAYGENAHNNGFRTWMQPIPLVHTARHMFRQNCEAFLHFLFCILHLRMIKKGEYIWTNTIANVSMRKEKAIEGDTENFSNATEGNYPSRGNFLRSATRSDVKHISSVSPEIYNYLRNSTKYNFPCCVHAILLFLKYYQIHVKEKNVLILSSNISIFLSLFAFFFQSEVSTTVYDPLRGHVLCRYDDKTKKCYLRTSNLGKLHIRDKADFKSKCKKFSKFYISTSKGYTKITHHDLSTLRKNMHTRIVKNSDLIIMAIGCPHILKKKYIKEGAIILDLGINLVPPGDRHMERMITPFFDSSVLKKKVKMKKGSSKIEEENFPCRRGLFPHGKFKKETNFTKLKKFKSSMKHICLSCPEIDKTATSEKFFCEESTGVTREETSPSDCSKGSPICPPSGRIKRAHNKCQKIISLKTRISKIKFANALGRFLQNYEIVGDADENCKQKCALISSVPGGLGPITTSMLFYNLYFS